MIIKGKKINIFLLIGGIFLTLILLLAIILGGYMYVRGYGQLKNNSLSTKLDAFKIENDFLDLGDKFDKEYNNILFCGVDKFNNTDVIMVISINKKLHKINILRIPRDVYIGENYATGKINAVYSQPKLNLSGADTLTYELNNIFRIKIDKYIFMTLDVFENMVDDIGGVDIVLKKDLRIDNSNIIKAGKVHLNGKLGADFVRHRKSYITGDIGRIHAQEQFVKALGKKFIEDKYWCNVFFLNKYYNIIETNIGRKEVNQYTEGLKDIDVNEIKTFVIEGEPVIHNGYSVYVADVDKTAKLLNQYFMPKGVVVKSSDLKLVKFLEPDHKVDEQEKQNLNEDVEDEYSEYSNGYYKDDYQEYFDSEDIEDVDDLEDVEEKTIDNDGESLKDEFREYEQY